MKRTRLEESTCPVARSLDIIGDWWSLLIVRDALRGLKRFGEFQKSLGIAKNMLASRLKKLVEEGILVLQPASDGSAWQEYVLTEKGRALQTVLVALSQWGNDFLFADNEFGSVLVDAQNRKPLRRLTLVSHDGVNCPPKMLCRNGLNRILSKR
ncbi:HxlR family transcriptional regulator [Lelliottia amnigena]|nr:HxlR family transcriptional regulator [Lelliottia amnigena]